MKGKMRAMEVLNPTMSKRFRVSKRIGVVLSVLWFVGFGGWMWSDQVNHIVDFYSDQLHYDVMNKVTFTRPGGFPPAAAAAAPTVQKPAPEGTRRTSKPRTA
jgi:hypothetical protein